MSIVSLFRPPLEIWGGVECTINRVGERFFDQLERSGHLWRIEDLDLFADLGIRTIRYPVQWERIAPDGLDNADWYWADKRLERLRELGMRPIIGLVHHGSGPRSTSLVEPSFAEGLAAFARAVAQRYPWVESYTPVNEPLTTARFSGLYGHWYPHGTDDRTFLRALVTECRSVILAMRAIREVNSSAQLVQTEDLGKTFSTPLLKYQADFENERRWLSFDLLCGRVDRHHRMWGFLCCNGITEAELHWFLDNSGPPDVMGINHYVISERFLDEHMERYPAQYHGGNGRHTYADIEAVRVRLESPGGHAVMLREAWQRYRLPLAITETQLECTREEQMRWILGAWHGAQDVRNEGVDVCAVTIWSLLGAYDWNTLVTSTGNFYEPGVFDMRAPLPRPTALAGLVRTLASGETPDHPVLTNPGWWHRPERILYPLEDASASSPGDAKRQQETRGIRARPLVITGAGGTLGKAFARLCELRGLPYKALTRHEVDITDVYFVMAVLKEIQPWAVVNAAGYVRVDDAEHELEDCYRANVVGPAILAAACNRLDVPLLTFSSDLVFNGNQLVPYVESDVPVPLSTYGRSKASAEECVLSLCPAALVVRTSSFFGPWDTANFVTTALRELTARRPFAAANDVFVSPTYVPDLVHTSLDLLIDGERGKWHLTNVGAITWADLAKRAAELAGIDATGLIGCPMEELGLVARRPTYSVLGSERGVLLSSLDDALARYVQECKVKGITALARASLESSSSFSGTTKRS